MAVIGWTIVGLVAGVVTTAMFRKHDTGGLAGALAVGVAAALASGTALALARVTEPGQFFDPAAWLIVLGVALLLLALYTALTHAGGAVHSARTPSSRHVTAERGEGSAERRERSPRRVTAPRRPVSRTTPVRYPRRRGVPAAPCRRSSSR